MWRPVEERGPASAWEPVWAGAEVSRQKRGCWVVCAMAGGRSMAGLGWPLRGHLLAMPGFRGHVSGLGAPALLGKRKQEAGGWVVWGFALPSC